MLWHKLIKAIERCLSSVWVYAWFDLHFIPPEVVELYLNAEEQDNEH